MISAETITPIRATAEQPRTILELGGESGQSQIFYDAYLFVRQSCGELRDALFVCLAFDQEQPTLFVCSKQRSPQFNESLQRPVLRFTAAAGMNRQSLRIDRSNSERREPRGRVFEMKPEPLERACELPTGVLPFV